MSNSLFNNPMIESIKKNMTPEQIESYKRKGELMYGNMDLESKSIAPKIELVTEGKENEEIDENTNYLKPVIESSAYIISMIKSGLHPSLLENDEKNLLKEVFGARWYLKYGYVDEDLESIVTFENLKLNE